MSISLEVCLSGSKELETFVNSLNSLIGFTVSADYNPDWRVVYNSRGFVGHLHIIEAIPNDPSGIKLHVSPTAKDYDSLISFVKCYRDSA